MALDLLQGVFRRKYVSSLILLADIIQCCTQSFPALGTLYVFSLILLQMMDAPLIVYFDALVSSVRVAKMVVCIH